MNYRQIYDNLMTKAKLRGLDKAALSYYTEEHHVVPICLGGSDVESNLVLLTGREHYVAHLLLTKFKTGQDYYKCQHALGAMTTMKDLRRLTSHQFEKCREAKSIAMAEYQNDKVAKGEHQWQTAEHAESRRQAITAMNKSDANPSKKPENRLAYSLRLKTDYTCPFCKYIGKGHANMKRYHFANCKSLTSHIVATNLATGAVHRFLTRTYADLYVSNYKVEHSITKRGGWSFKLKDFSLLIY